MQSFKTPFFIFCFLTAFAVPGWAEEVGPTVYARVTGVASDDILNVRSGPSVRNDIVGALSNGTRVRRLDCRTEGGATWCLIQMLDDMRSEGWVNARYLEDARQSSDASEHAGDHGGVEGRCAEAVASEVGVSSRDVEVTSATISEGTGRLVVHVRVPDAKADWICEAERDGTVASVFYGGGSE